MLRLINLEEIKASFLKVSSIIDLLSEKDSNAIVKTKEWLLEIEKILTNNKIPEVGKIACARGSIISAEMGFVPAGFQVDNVNKLKLRIFVALEVLKQSSNIVFEIIQKDIVRIEEAERIMRQVIAIAKSKGLLDDFPNPPLTTDILRSFWKKFALDNNLTQGVVSIEGLIGPYDSLIIFDRILALY
jgi:hypothetical protein